MSPQEDSERARWFNEEVYPHDSSLKAYLRGAFPALRDWEDLIQESYLRTWKARAVHPIRSARGFLFTVARHLAINRVQRERISPIVAVMDLSVLPVAADGPSAAEAACRREEISLLADGIERLPSRCREIFILRKLKGLSQREIAAALNISEQTVQVQIWRGVQRCEAFLRRRGIVNVGGGNA